MSENVAEIRRFIKDFGDKIINGEAALFIGAGLSRSAGYVDWKQLLQPIAEDLGLDISKEADLLSIPQYFANKEQSRQAISQRIVDALEQGTSPTENHRIIARLPIEVLWTTNYDFLIEDAFKKFGKTIDKKIENADFSINRHTDAILYKMHGDVSHLDRIILLKQDYEAYEETHNLFADGLRGDFLHKTFLFLGYSFSDPNLAAIIAKVSSQQGENKRIHYCLTKIPNDEYDLKKFQYQCGELQRHGIHTIGIDSYERIPEILRKVEKYITRNNIFLSGANALNSQNSAFNLSEFSRKLGHKLISNKYRLISGFGIGIAEEAVLAAYRAISEKRDRLSPAQLQVYPFPRNEKNADIRKEKFKKHREDLLSMSGIIIAVSGNKKTENGDIIKSDGVREEIDIAKKLGRYIIPVGNTGDVAEEICREAVEKPEIFLPNIPHAKERLSELLDKTKSTDDTLDIIFKILSEIKSTESLK